MKLLHNLLKHGVVYYTAGSNRITGDSTLSLNSWHHIVVERQVVAQNYMLMVFKRVVHIVIVTHTLQN